MLISVVYVLFLKAKSKKVETYQQQVVYIHPSVHLAFTWGRWVFLSPELLEKQERREIILHEFVHRNQGHTIDLILSEIVCAWLWFNPFVFFHFKAIKENHEYLADQGVLSQGVDELSYQQLLLNTAFKTSFWEVHGFGNSTIKKRIKMINFSNNKNYWKWGLLLPYSLLILWLFSNNPIVFAQHKGETHVEQLGDSLFTKIENHFVERKGTGSFESLNKGELDFIFPLDNPEISSGYGYRKHPFTKKKKFHKGVDFKAPKGTPVYAVEDGVVIAISTVGADGKKKGYGNFIVIKHASGYHSMYAQLEKFQEDVLKGKKEIKKGTQIATVGSSGQSTGPHLHFEVKKDGENIDPMTVLKKK
ncbi:hypothetical protein GCM10023331_19540 [Algivirga pacifica]|uniref:Peptidase M23 domain-containing protein n=2 Tax=Algivirga pacifica TaxID=1162670 RepID=A0ABP9D8R7_9BACT